MVQPSLILIDITRPLWSLIDITLMLSKLVDMVLNLLCLPITKETLKGSLWWVMTGLIEIRMLIIDMNMSQLDLVDQLDLEEVMGLTGFE